MMMPQAIELLNAEHETIKQRLNDARTALSALCKSEEDLSPMQTYLNFFRNYADGYHHHKEEEILFPEMCRRNELLEQGVIEEMLQNHADFREMLADFEAAISSNRHAEALQILDRYAEALLDHIAVEDDEVFQMAESLFSESEIENIYYRFLDCDRERGDEEKAALEIG